jgi:hypothetical protein
MVCCLIMHRENSASPILQARVHIYHIKSWQKTIVYALFLREGNSQAFHKGHETYPTLFVPAVSNGERVRKLSVVEGTFMRMRDFLLPRNTAGCVYSCQIVKWCNTCSSYSRFASIVTNAPWFLACHH